MGRPLQAIRAVKAGRVDEGRDLLDDAAAEFLDRGCDGLVIVCTDLSVAFRRRSAPYADRTVDANVDLADACIERLLPPVHRGAEAHGPDDHPISSKGP